MGDLVCAELRDGDDRVGAADLLGRCWWWRALVVEAPRGDVVEGEDVTARRLYIETMQEILTKTPSIVVDDKLQGIVPYLPLDPTRMEPNRVAPK